MHVAPLFVALWNMPAIPLCIAILCYQLVEQFTYGLKKIHNRVSQPLSQSFIDLNMRILNVSNLMKY